MPKAMKFVMDVHIEAPFTDDDIRDENLFYQDKDAGFPVTKQDTVTYMEDCGFTNVQLTKFDYVEVSE